MLNASDSAASRAQFLMMLSSRPISGAWMAGPKVRFPRLTS